MQDFRNLKVWQKARQLALFVYRNTADFPQEETFVLKHSMRKTAVDIPAYIAEASGKSNNRDAAASMNAAIALTTRREYYAIMAPDLELIPETPFSRMGEATVEVRTMLTGFARTLA
jgi:four helix bundle protein